jgi:hypothetical protein
VISNAFRPIVRAVKSDPAAARGALCLRSQITMMSTIMRQLSALNDSPCETPEAKENGTAGKPWARSGSIHIESVPVRNNAIAMRRFIAIALSPIPFATRLGILHIS